MSNTNQPKNEFTPQVEDPNKPDAPKEQHGLFDTLKDKFSAHKAAPGPVHHQDIGNVPEEGTKEERRTKAEALNK